MKIGVYTLFGLMFCITGCILPIPHRRVSVAGSEGMVYDADTGKPIIGALVSVMYPGSTTNVFTDAQGRYKVDDEKSWHGAYFIGIPVSFSLFPTLDAPLFPTAISVSADGYIPWKWQSWCDIEETENSSDVATDSDPSCVNLKPSNGYPLNRGWPRPRGDVRRAGVSP